MDFLEVLNGMNVQVPIGHVVAGIVAISTLVFVVKKVITVALAITSKVTFAIASKVTFASVAAGLLMITGLTGIGFSVGELNSGKVNKHYMSNMSNDDLTYLSTRLDKEKLGVVLDYVKARDSRNRDKEKLNVVLDYAQGQDLKNVTEPTVEYLDRKMPCTLLGFSLALLFMAAAAWFAESK